MERWKKISYMVAIYLFLTELRPLEPYMTAYLTGPDANVPFSEVANAIEVIKSYSALFVSLIMLITSDYLLYKANIIFLTVWSCLSYFLMTGLLGPQYRLATVGIGGMYSASVLVFSYMFAQIEDTSRFQMASGIAITGMQFGRVTGDMLAQIIVNATGQVYTALPYCNVFTMFLAVICVCTFPPVVQKDNYPDVYSPNENSLICKDDATRSTKANTTDKKQHDTSLYHNNRNRIVHVIKELWMNFKTTYSNPVIQKRSLSYVITMAAYVMILQNMDVLYSYVVKSQGNHDVLNNGFAEAIATVCGGISAYQIGKVRLDWAHYGDMYTAFSSFLMGILMILCYFHSHLILVYLWYILFYIVNQAFSVIIISEISKRLKSQCYCLVLEFNYIVSLITVCTMMFFLVQMNFMDITVPGRFLFIGGILVVFGAGFLINSMFLVKDSKYETLL